MDHRRFYFGEDFLLSPCSCLLFLSAEQQRVHEMWQHNLDALMDVQANVKDALADRGLSEAEIAIRDAEPTAPGESTLFRGRSGAIVIVPCGVVAAEL